MSEVTDLTNTTAPAVQLDPREVAPGITTSEHAVTKSTQVASRIISACGLLIAVAGPLLAQTPANSKFSIIGGACLTALGLLSDTLTSLGYNAGRVALKNTAMQAQAMKP
jgi:hypothetical protein